MAGKYELNEEAVNVNLLVRSSKNRRPKIQLY